MKIGILETGLLNEKLEGLYDPYPVMFEQLLDRAGQPLSYQSYSVIRGEMPMSVHECDGWLITGSRFGVYEHLDWMTALEGFIREIDIARVPLVGICFGHQIIAQALGGEVVKSDKGWGIGLIYYDVIEQQPWMTSPLEKVGIYAFHQDQIEKLPPAARVFLSSDFCPYAGLQYGESIISIQAHPEFEEDYELALIDMYGGNVVPATVTDKALDFIRKTGEKAQTQVLADWIVMFFINFQSRKPESESG